MTGLGVVALLLASVVLCTAQPQPPLVCPQPAGFGVCIESCSDDLPCENSQLCCSNGCGHVCMTGVPRAVNCSDPQLEGFNFNPTPCEFCTCLEGQRICYVVDCAFPDCDGGVMPFTPPGECCPRCPQLACPDTTGLIGTCDERCSEDSPCESSQLCCSNGCGHACMAPSVNCSGVPDGYQHQRTPCETCTCNGGELRCARIYCDWPQCPDGATPVTRPGDCCPGCPTSSCTEGGNTYASGTSWNCSDGCNTCSCNDGVVTRTEIFCPSPCTDATGVHPSGGESWTCPDGCNTCTCHNGLVASTRIACASCTEGGNTYASGTSWNCSDGCNICACRNGLVISTLIACTLRPCTDATGVHPSGGESWTCPDGCNTCTCHDGVIASTRRACAPCTDGDTGVVYQSGQSWRCRDRCPTCTCQNGRIVVNATGCPSNCTTADGDIIPEGGQWQSGPCTTCYCREGREICAAISCAFPYCGPGVHPVFVPGQCCPDCPSTTRPPHVTCPDLSDVVTTCDVGCTSDDACEGNQICCPGGCSSLCVDPVRLTCPDVSGVAGACVESCRNSSQCDSGRLCCSNGCGRACVVADELNCSSVACPAVQCSYGAPFTPVGECCPRCHEDCRLVFCANPECESYEELVTPEGQCCPRCQCNRTLCPVLRCKNGAPFTPKGDCCPRCPRDCTEGGNTYASGASWNCSDGCNSCSCHDGEVASTDAACPSACTDEDTGVVYQSGQSWRCRDECRTCTCRYGRIAINATGCPSNCTEGELWNPDPCTTCSCRDGRAKCLVLACALPYCGPGVQPVSVLGQCCLECPPPSNCTEGGNTYASGASWTCSDGCNTCSCNDGAVARTEIGCPPNCAAVSCLAVECGAGQVAVTPVGECCPACQDCSSVSCSVRACAENERRVYPNTQCCPECQDCRLVRCAAVDCEHGEAFTPEGECCPQCPPEERLCEDYGREFDVSAMDPCLRCECNADFVYECRKVATGPGCEPLSCQLDDQLFRPGAFFTEGCSSCECTNGVARCSEKGCNAVDGSGVKFDMGFAGNYDDYKDVTEQEALIKVLKKQLVSKFKHLKFMDSQVKDVKVYEGSVYLTFMIVAVEGGADPSTVAKTLETEHRSGALLLVSSNRTLVPLASTFSVTYVAAGSDMQDGSKVAAIVVPVVVGVVAIVAIVAATIVILCIVKTVHSQPPSGKATFSEGVCTIENEYTSVDEKLKWDSSSVSSDKAAVV